MPSVLRTQTGADGNRTPANFPDETCDSQEGGAKSGASLVETVLDDPNLIRLVEAWSTLPDAIRRGILAFVREAGDSG